MEAARDMQITIVRTTMEASGDSKLYNTRIGVTSLRPHQHHPSTFHLWNFKPQLAPSIFAIPLLLNSPFLFLGPFAAYFTSLVKDTCQVSFLSLSSPQLPLINPYWSSSKLPLTPMAPTEIPSDFSELFHISIDTQNHTTNFKNFHRTTCNQNPSVRTDMQGPFRSFMLATREHQLTDTIQSKRQIHGLKNGASACSTFPTRPQKEKNMRLLLRSGKKKLYAPRTSVVELHRPTSKTRPPTDSFSGPQILSSTWR